MLGMDVGGKVLWFMMVVRLGMDVGSLFVLELTRDFERGLQLLLRFAIDLKKKKYD